MKNKEKECRYYSEKMRNRVTANSLKNYKIRFDRSSKEVSLAVSVAAELKKIGISVRQIRMYENISAKKLAKMANMAPKTIWKVEDGQFVTAESLLRVLIVLNCKIRIEGTDAF